MALDKILENLVSNAVKFSPLGRQIHIRVQPCVAHVEWRIRDEGPGFQADDRDPMFRRYRRLSARPTAGEPSTGLGLSIVRKLIQASKAELVLESSPGEGASWLVRVPRPPKP
jgi:two-component system sensor histidine kinase/response regulator